jgi:hypothetical protein
MSTAQAVHYKCCGRAADTRAKLVDPVILPANFSFRSSHLEVLDL